VQPRLPTPHPPLSLSVVCQRCILNYHDATVNGTDRTDNICESWNRGFSAVVSQDHPSLWCLFEALQQHAAAATTVLLQAALDQPPAKRIKQSTVQLQQHLRSICCDRRDGRKSLAQTLTALGHTPRSLSLTRRNCKLRCTHLINCVINQ